MRSRTWTENHRQTAQHKPFLGAAKLFWRGVAEALRRARQRRDLALLSEHSLRDIGLCRADVDFEIKKPFWRA